MLKISEKLEKNILVLHQIGLLYSNSNKKAIKNLEQLELDISNFDQSEFYYYFMGNPHKYDISEPWKVIRNTNKYTSISQYSIDELVNILKGIIIYEVFTNHGEISTTASVPIFFEIAVLDFQVANEIKEWSEIFGFNNSYFPYGERSKIAFYQFIYKYSNDPKIIENMKLKLQIAGYIKFNT